LAQAIELVHADGELRRSLIRSGLALARKQTLERFIDNVRTALEPDLQSGRAVDLHEVEKT
jgi:hypothetical protein